MDEAKFIKKEDDIAEYEITDDTKKTGEGKEYKAEKIEKKEEH